MCLFTVSGYKTDAHCSKIWGSHLILQADEANTFESCAWIINIDARGEPITTGRFSHVLIGKACRYHAKHSSMNSRIIQQKQAGKRNRDAEIITRG